MKALYRVLLLLYPAPFRRRFAPELLEAFDEERRAARHQGVTGAAALWRFILADLATKANTEESTQLASRVQSNLVKHLSSKYSGVKDLGTKEALFYVLLGVRMPAILIETSFLSHPEEEKRLGSKTYQRDMAQAIANGVQDFLDHRGRLAQVN